MTNNKISKNIADEGLIFNLFERSLEENCPLAAVNASHFLPCELQYRELNLWSFAK